MKRLIIFLLFLFISAPLIAFGSQTSSRIEKASAPDDKAFRDELSLVARKAVELKQSRFSIIQNINDSYRLTVNAIMLLAEKGDVKSAVPMLRDATGKYEGNRLAYLLLGSAFERAGLMEDAAHAYAGFYRYSLSLSPIETQLISPSSLQIFRSYVEMRFREWKWDLPEAAVPLGVRKTRSLVMIEQSKTGQLLNLILPLMVITGLAFLLLGRMWQLEPPPFVAYFLLRFYLLAVAAYVVWAAHFFLGLPFLISMEVEFMLIPAAGTVFISIIYALNRLRARRREKPVEGTMRCPKCKQIVLQLAVECPYCKRLCQE
jgi:hypothetical protein